MQKAGSLSCCPSRLQLSVVGMIWAPLVLFASLIAKPSGHTRACHTKLNTVTLVMLTYCKRRHTADDVCKKEAVKPDSRCLCLLQKVAQHLSVPLTLAIGMSWLRKIHVTSRGCFRHLSLGFAHR